MGPGPKCLCLDHARPTHSYAPVCHYQHISWIAVVDNHHNSPGQHNGCIPSKKLDSVMLYAFVGIGIYLIVHHSSWNKSCQNLALLKKIFQINCVCINLLSVYIFANMLHLCSDVSSAPAGFSDHNLIGIIRKTKVTKRSQTMIRKVSYKDFNIDWSCLDLVLFIRRETEDTDLFSAE